MIKCYAHVRAVMSNQHESHQDNDHVNDMNFVFENYVIENPMCYTNVFHSKNPCNEPRMNLHGTIFCVEMNLFCTEKWNRLGYAIQYAEYVTFVDVEN